MGFSPFNNPLTNYAKESKEELKKVTWPSKKAVFRNTLIVIAISAAVAVFFGTLDYGLSYAFEKFIIERTQ